MSTETLVVALFHDADSAARAVAAMLAPGMPSDRAEIMHGGDLRGGSWHPVQDLFVPEDDYHDYHHALGRGHAVVVVRPQSVHERDAAIWALEAGQPIDIAQNGRRWRGTPSAVDRMAVNHATVSRADMLGRAVGGRDEVILDMTGQKMTVRVMNEDEMAAAPFAPASDPASRPEPLAPPPPERAVPTTGTTYTYGVPADVVRRMSPEEQVLAQPPALGEPGEPTARKSFLKTVGGHTHLGWRDHHPEARMVRLYSTERPASAEG